MATLSQQALMLVAVALMAAPLLWVLSLSLQDPGAFYRFPPNFLPHPPRWSSYPDAWQTEPFARLYWNSIFTTSAIVLGQIATSALAAYALSQIAFRGRDKLLLVILGTMMVPIQVTFVPAYILLSRLHWVNTYQALIVPFVASGFGTFLLYQAFKQVPRSLVDAARIDGANHLTILRRVMLPLSAPAVITLAALNFVWHYNDFFWPLIVTNSNNMRTLPVGLATMILAEGAQGTQWNQVMAADVFVVAPVLAAFVLMQRYLLRTSLTVGVK